MSRITYYTEDKSFVCVCGRTWYARKSYPDGYKCGRSIKCNKCFHQTIPDIEERFAPVEIKDYFAHGCGFFAIRPVLRCEVWCRRCDQWFPVGDKFKRWPICPSCGIVVSLNYAKSTGKYREWEEWESTQEWSLLRRKDPDFEHKRKQGSKEVDRYDFSPEEAREGLRVRGIRIRGI